MAKKSSVITLAADIQKILEEYEGDVELLNKETIKKIGQKGKQALQQKSRDTFGGTGAYAAGWAVKVEEQNRAFAKATLYNAKLPGLPHLLEYGHAKRGGGRVSGRVHISAVEDELIKAFEQELEKSL